jgi:hypothetical protein
MDQVVALADPELKVDRGKYQPEAKFLTTGVVAESNTGRVAAVMKTADGSKYIVKYWSLQTGQQGSHVIEDKNPEETPITAIALSGDGEYLVVSYQHCRLSLGL